MRNTHLSHSVLQTVLAYDPATGIFTWRERTSKRIHVGDRAGVISRGMWQIPVYGSKYLGHRLAWFYYHGKWPDGNITVKNGDFTDIRIENLIPQTAQETANKATTRNTNKSGVKGVSWNSQKNKWQSTITVNGVRFHLGYYENIDDAAIAYQSAVAESPLRGGSLCEDRRAYRWRQILWKKVQTKYAGDMTWEDAEDFYKSVGDVNSTNVMVYKINEASPVGHDNFSVDEKIIVDEWAKKNRKNNPQQQKSYYLRRDFGISLDQYNEMLNSQNGVCAACKNPETSMRNGKVKALAVDHCHKTGKIRGLLCSGCNTGLGKFQDSVELIQAAIDYLNKHSQTGDNHDTHY